MPGGVNTSIDERLERLDIRLPEPPPPAGSYSPVVIRSGLGFVSAQVPFRNGELVYTGRVGIEQVVTFTLRGASERFALPD